MIITCEQLVEAATDAREGALGRLDELSYRAHLAWCRHCRTYVEQLDAVVTALGSVRHQGEEVSSQQREELLARLRRRGR